MGFINGKHEEDEKEDNVIQGNQTVNGTITCSSITKYDNDKKTMVPNLSYINLNTPKYECLFLRSVTSNKGRDDYFYINVSDKDKIFVRRSVTNITQTGVILYKDTNDRSQSTPVYKYDGYKIEAIIIYKACIFENIPPHFPNHTSSLEVNLLSLTKNEIVSFNVGRNNAQIGIFQLVRGTNFVFRVKPIGNADNFSLYLCFEYVF